MLPATEFEQAIHARLQSAADGRAERVTAETAGYYTDVQQASLQQLRGLRVARFASCLIVTLTHTPAFEVGRSVLTSAAEAVLKELAQILREYEATLVSIHGHTDDSGSAAVNQQLSERRALAVAQFLLTQGVRAHRLVAVGHGQSQPVAPNDSPEGRERNRRIELHLDPVRP